MHDSRLIKRPNDGPLRGGRIDELGIASRNSALSRLYDIEFCQMGAGDLKVEIEYVASGRSVLYRELYDSNTHAMGTLRDGLFGFSIPLLDRESVWWGHRLGSDMLATAIGGESIDIMFRPGFRHLVAIIPHDSLLRAISRTRMDASVARSVSTGRCGNLLRADPQALERLGDQLQRLLDQPDDAPPRRAARAFDDLLLGAVLSLLDSGRQRVESARMSSALFRRAIEVYDSMPEPPNVTALCLALRTSPRTLEAAFSACAGMGPHRFFMLRRLNRANALLCRAEPEPGTVTRIASELGFTELGRFAVRYRQLFGESPSQTLAAIPRRIFQLPLPR